MMMKMFWAVTAISAAFFGAALQLLSIEALGTPPTKPPFPIPGREYVSATRDGQTDQSLFYFDIFDFGQRIKDAKVLVAGSSHAEFGINAATLSPDKKALNMALGGGESIDFAIELLNRYRPSLDLLVVDPFTPDRGLSTEGKRVLGLSKLGAYLHIFEIWAGFLRDWILQGFLPRMTLSHWNVSFEQPITVAVIRNWQTADVVAFYSDQGEVFSDAAKGHYLSVGGLGWSPVRPSKDDALSLKARAATTVVTTVPYPHYSEDVSRGFATDIGARFVAIAPNGLTYYDYHHLNSAGRTIATARLHHCIK